MIESISLCMVVYNEAHRIAKTLEAAAPHVDEIVIVNQMSTDETDVAAVMWHGFSNFNGDLYIVDDKHWGYCEPSRKLAHDSSRGDWILVLDADESISEEFAADMRYLDDYGYTGARLKRSFWLAGEHRFTGDYQYRFFNRKHVRYLDEIHTDPQAVGGRVMSADYVGIWHEKSWEEQIRDEVAYEEILKDQKGKAADRKRALNVHLDLLNKTGLTAKEADSMSIEERIERGISAEQ